MKKLIIDDKYFWPISKKDEKFISKYTTQEMFEIFRIVLKGILGIDIKHKFDCEKCETIIWWE